MEKDPGSQRLFEHPAGHCILLAKDGRAVQFQVDGQGRVRIVRKLSDVDFKATGDGLRAEGWRCVGPGMEYAWVLDAPAPPDSPNFQ